MIPHIPLQRQKSSGGKPFSQLVSYIDENKSQEQQQQLTDNFENIIDYATATIDKTTNVEKCIAIRTHGIIDLATAGNEMNAVAARNSRCKDPAFHFILSWPEHEHPDPDSIFDAAEHAIHNLGLTEHQYILAIHGNTDNTHCHIAVNRIHPKSYKSHHIEWAKKTLHLAARESELKHGWTHDNGIYIVNDQKQIILNKDHAKSIADALPYAHTELDKELPAWFDPESLESWLKSNVARSLKRALPKFRNWNDLHNWLATHNITLTNTGGGGMRLYATSADTGEIVDMPASKGLRLLKRSELEKRWGEFTSHNRFDPIPSLDSGSGQSIVPCINPKLSHLTPHQLAKGIEHVLRTSLDHGIPPNPNLVLHTEPDKRIPPAHRRGSLHELSAGGMDDAGQPDSAMLLQDSLHVHMGNSQTGQDQDLRRPGTSEVGRRGQRSLTRDNSKREERKAQRAAARADLRQRFSQYKRFVRDGDVGYWQRIKEIKAQRTQELKDIRENAKAERIVVDKKPSLTNGDRSILYGKIFTDAARHKLQAEVAYQEQIKLLQATRFPPLGWREWLHEQSNLGDQAALSALRGIVYQAQRDAKRKSAGFEDDEEIEESSDLQFRKLMARLLEEEKKEIAIRAARSNAMRPYEVDALLVRYANMQWRVTGNGNIEYSDRTGEHLFTDRGNRVTFDRARVTDEEIRLALVHAQQKFGNKLTLTGQDPIFTERMARLADDMGIGILNPELKETIAIHRKLRIQAMPTPGIAIKPQELIKTFETVSEPLPVQTPEEQLKSKVLSIDPRAQFEEVDTTDSQRLYAGPVAAESDNKEQALFVQRTGRGLYVIHAIKPPDNHNEANIEIRYRNGQAIMAIPSQHKDKGRNE